MSQSFGPARTSFPALTVSRMMDSGILLDPVYSGKGMAGLIGEIRKGTFSKDENIVFVHTGGSAALFAYEELFSNKAA